MQEGQKWLYLQLACTKTHQVSLDLNLAACEAITDGLGHGRKGRHTPELTTPFSAPCLSFNQCGVTSEELVAIGEVRWLEDEIQRREETCALALPLADLDLVQSK